MTNCQTQKSDTDILKIQSIYIYTHICNSDVLNNNIVKFKNKTYTILKFYLQN